MNTLKSTAILFIALITFSSAAIAANTPTSKLVEIAKEKVRQAEANDWETFAESAEICLMKNENLHEASIWVDLSLMIDQNAYNLELKGDFLVKEGKKKEALKYYTAAARMTKIENIEASNADIQKKIWALR